MLKFLHGITNRSYCILGAFTRQSGGYCYRLVWSKVVHESFSSDLSISSHEARLGNILPSTCAMDGIHALPIWDARILI
jgi:hypothetical protein